MSVRTWGTGAGALVVLFAAGVWARGSSAVDAGLWAEVRPAIEARLVARSAGTGTGESGTAAGARWFCRAEALELEASGDRVRAGIDSLCEEFGAHEGALVLFGGAETPQVVRLERDTAHGGYRVVSTEEAPDDAGAAWYEKHFSPSAVSRIHRKMASAGLEVAARAHFGLPADAPVRNG